MLDSCGAENIPHNYVTLYISHFCSDIIICCIVISSYPKEHTFLTSLVSCVASASSWVWSALLGHMYLCCCCLSYTACPPITRDKLISIIISRCDRYDESAGHLQLNKRRHQQLGVYGVESWDSQMNNELEGIRKEATMAKFKIRGIVSKCVTNRRKTPVLDVIGFLCVSLGSSTVQLHDGVGSIRACACSEAVSVV
jgi:hypothetical protein